MLFRSTSDPASTAYLEQYAHGSMSSGMISLDTWRQQLMPMLFERARARLPDRPQNADQGPHDPDASLSTLVTLPRTLMRWNRLMRGHLAHVMAFCGRRRVGRSEWPAADCERPFMVN